MLNGQFVDDGFGGIRIDVNARQPDGFSVFVAADDETAGENPHVVPVFRFHAEAGVKRFTVFG